MGKRESGFRHGNHDGGNRKYIVGSIAAVLVIIAAIAVAAWVIYRDMNPSDQGQDTEHKQAAVQQDTDENRHEDSTDSSETEDVNGGAADSDIEEMLGDMTLEEKVCQLFMVTPEALTGVGTVTQAGTATQEAVNAYPVGGVIYFSQNLQDPDQTRTMLENTQRYAMERTGIPIFLSVDEEDRKSVV